ncbi:MAG: ABC-F family ATP-binding cassette domain-containing protein [Oscillospiraceae bacterium]|nr:ABC-F family ATP-binding cassette domain-containing protein [Oscillospiraceae bacterium]
MIITLENICKSYNGEKVLDNVALTIENTDRIGLIGINGCGKSTLLRIISGLENADSMPEPNPPRIFKGKNCRIGFLQQDSGLQGESSVFEAMREVFAELLSIAKRLDELREGVLDEKHADEYSKKSAYFESNDGYLIDMKINKVLHGMGFPPESYERIVSSLSGGERTRLALAKLLLESPDLLILDEPTNHLDFDTVLWLEDYLKDYNGGLLIVSHDRYFLDKLVNSVCEIERGTLRRFKGNYTSFMPQKKQLCEHQLKEYESQTEEIAKLKDYIARNIVRASTSNMAKSRVKQLEKIEANRLIKPVLGEKSAKIRFEYDREPPKEILTVKNVDLTVGEGTEKKTLVESLSFDLRRRERLAVIGANGTGKSTLLKVLQRKHPHFHGLVEWGENVKISYFDQTNSDVFFPGDTAMNAVHRRYPKLSELAVRSLLASVRLTGEDVFKRVESLSGGERAKLRFALMSLERGNVLILDEPTNHLDISTRDVLESALLNYPGTVVFVSHDRYLLDKLATHIIEIAPESSEGVKKYNGGFAEFTEHAKERIKENRRNQEQDSPLSDKLSEKKSVPNRSRSKQQRAHDAQKRTRIRELEAEIESLETLLSEIQSDMEKPDVFANHEILQEKCALYEETKIRLSNLGDEWLELTD